MGVCLFTLLWGIAGQPAPTCAVEVKVPPPWSEGDKQVGVINLVVRNLADVPVPAPWRLRLIHADYREVRDTWNWRVIRHVDGEIVGAVEDAGLALQAGGANAVTVGVTVVSVNADLMPTAVWVDDASCAVSMQAD
jgi:hypothetical protein